MGESFKMMTITLASAWDQMQAGMSNLEVSDCMVDLLEISLLSGISSANSPSRLRPPIFKKRIGSESFDALKI